MVSGRLSRLTRDREHDGDRQRAGAASTTGASSSRATRSALSFGADGALYVSGGDGASFSTVDYGQFGGRTGPIEEPVRRSARRVGGTETPPTAEGGALRSLNLRTIAGPAVLNGAILRLDPSTGARLPGNPLAGSADPKRGGSSPRDFATPSASRSGLGRTTSGSATSAGAPGRRSTASRIPTAVGNFGWPCYEGAATAARLPERDLNLCTNLYRRWYGARSLLHLQPRRERRHGGRLSDRELVDHGPGLLHGRHVSERVQRRPVLRRPFA